MDRVEVSIVIATYNEERHIEPCVRSVLEAEPFAETREILVVDGGSTDRTREIVRGLAAAHPEVRLLENPARYAPSGFNTGIRASRGDWIFVLSAHSEYDRSYFRLCLETARQTGADNTGGLILFRTRGDALAGRLSRALGLSRFGMGAARCRQENVTAGPADTAGFGCFPRRTFERFGLYDERLILNQDWELNQRIIRGGGVVWLDPRIRAYYYARETFGAVVSRAFNLGRWNAYMWAIAPHSLTARHALPAAFTASLAVPGVGVGALAAHQAIGLLAAIWQARELGDARLAAALPPMFLAVHLAYGLGTWAGAASLLAGRSPWTGRPAPERLPPRTPAPRAG